MDRKKSRRDTKLVVDLIRSITHHVAYSLSSWHLIMNFCLPLTHNPSPSSTVITRSDVTCLRTDVKRHTNKYILLVVMSQYSGGLVVWPSKDTTTDAACFIIDKFSATRDFHIGISVYGFAIISYGVVFSHRYCYPRRHCFR